MKNKKIAKELFLLKCEIIRLINYFDKNNNYIQTNENFNVGKNKIEERIVYMKEFVKLCNENVKKNG